MVSTPEGLVARDEDVSVQQVASSTVPGSISSQAGNTIGSLEVIAEDVTLGHRDNRAGNEVRVASLCQNYGFFAGVFGITDSLDRLTPL